MTNSDLEFLEFKFVSYHPLTYMSETHLSKRAIALYYYKLFHCIELSILPNYICKLLCGCNKHLWKHRHRHSSYDHYSLICGYKVWDIKYTGFNWNVMYYIFRSVHNSVADTERKEMEKIPTNVLKMTLGCRLQSKHIRNISIHNALFSGKLLWDNCYNYGIHVQAGV